MSRGAPPIRRQRRNAGTDRTYGAVLQKYARRVSMKQMYSISLANVLAGDTCSPISLADFEAYLAFQEHTLENLQFVVWFQDYRKRFFALPEELQAASPGPSKFTLGLPSPARTAQRAADSKRRAELVRIISAPSSPVTQYSVRPLPASRTQSSSNLYSVLHSVPSSPAYSLREEHQRLALVHEQPFREECQCIVATFFRPGAAKELPLDPTLRDTVIRDLTWNTHPDVFLPAYEEMYDMLTTTSLPRFLAGATANINLPKQIFFYVLGAVNVCVAVAIAAVIIATATARPWRLFAVPFAAIGGMQIYSAWRGFCSQVWSRHSTQLRVWELQEMDEEAAAHWDRVLLPDDSCAKQDAAHRENDEKRDVPHYENIKTPSGGTQNDTGGVSVRAGTAENSPAKCAFVDMQSIAPFAPCAAAAPSGMCTSQPHPSSTSSTAESDAIHASRAKRTHRPPPLRLQGLAASSDHFSVATSDTDESEAQWFARPPVFGPERVVLDAHIQAAHREIMRVLLFVGFCWTVGFSALILSVPGRKQ